MMIRMMITLVACAAVPYAVFAATAGDDLHTLQTDYWEFCLRESPLLATSTGDTRYNDQLPVVSVADSERRDEAKQKFLDRLQALDQSALTDADRINYQILQRTLSDALAEFRFQNYLMPITQRDGFYLEFPQLHRDVPLVTLKDYENYIARLKAFGKFTDGHIELMRAGITANRVLPAVVLVGWEAGVDAQIVDDPTRSEIYSPFKKFPSTIPEAEYDRLREQARQAISTVVIPAYKRFRKFMADEYVPRARDTIGASALPAGRDYYRHRVKMFTTTDLTPDEIHQLGMAEVKRIRAEMEQVMAEVEFKGAFADFLDYLREEPRFYASTPEELLQKVSFILKKIDGELPGLFRKLPRTPYGVREIPAYVAPRTTAAYYQPPNGDGTKAGFYYVNTYNLKSRPFYNLEALSLHEAVPGHHLQIALQQELEDVPPFRRFSDFTAFVEGWALYAERLGLEAGFYKDPYSNFGRLTMEMWRACRLVVDSGMHYLGWTREQAIRFLADNTALSMHDIGSEVDRYIAWPGQALAYKVGELKIRQLRKLAEDQLGSSFDIREFHDVVLGSGALPLDILEANVKKWLATKS
jgi:uncharacterized protein (DUF885 family)